KKGPGSPVVIVDADVDPAARPLRRRIAAAAGGILVAVGGGAAWLGISSIPAAPASREPVASTPAPAASAPSALPNTFQLPDPDPAPPSSPPPAPVRTTRPPVTMRAPVPKRSPPPPPPPPSRVERRDLEPGLLSVNAIPWGSVLPAQSRELLGQGVKAYQALEYDAAAALLEQSLGRDSASGLADSLRARALTYLAATELFRGQRDSAVGAFRQLVLLNPRYRPD